MNPSQRVAVVGAGNVGASIAYSILNQGIATDILIIDIIESFAKAQVIDLQDAANFTKGSKVSYAQYSDLLDGDVVVITCGVPQKEGQSRVELLGINAKIIREVIGKIKATGKKVYIVMVSNPVDVLTYIAVNEAGLPAGMVFGSGTYLDTGRLRKTISQELSIDSTNIHAYTVGEHGDTSFPVLSCATVGGIPLNQILNVDAAFYTKITQQVRDEAYKIIEGKKSTYYGIGTAVAKIVRAIIRNEQVIIPLSVNLNGAYGQKDVCFGIPVKVDNSGVKIVGELPLNDQEQELLQKSADYIRENIASIK